MVVTGVILILIQGAASQMCLNQQVSEQDQQLTTDLCLNFNAAAIDLRVVGGAPIKSTDAPWHTIVALEGAGELDFTRILGGGSLVTSRLVLTAAHLFWTNSIDGRVCPKYVRDLMTAKECHDLKGGCPKGCRRVASDSVQLYFGVTEALGALLQPPYAIDRIELHPGYNKQSISNNVIDGHDIAIVRTNLNVEFHQTVQLICLPTPDLEFELLTAETGTSITGFGRDGKSGHNLVENLQQGCLHLVLNSTCREAYRPIVRKAPSLFPQGELTGDQLCARGDGVDSCQGDSGGGLVVNREGRSLLVGVTSLGSTSCRTSLPGLYTNIFSHLPWIQQQMRTDRCRPWSVCSASCSSPGQQVRTCSGVLEDGTPWSQDETRSCNAPLCVADRGTDDVSERLVVLGGWVGNVSQSSNVFMESCPIEGNQIPDMPRNISHGVAVYLPNSLPPSLLFCGGLIPETGPSSQCFEYEVENTNDIREAIFAEPAEWKKTVQLDRPRANSAITFLPEASEPIVWITGGRNSKRVVLDTTEILAKNPLTNNWTVTQGPKLMTPSASHCAVHVPEPGENHQQRQLSDPNNSVFIIGGAQFDSESRKFVMTDLVQIFTWRFQFGIFDKETAVAREHSRLKTARSGHACAVVNESQKLGIMVAGGQRATKEMLDSVEYLDLAHGVTAQWKELTALPRKLTGAKLIMKLGLPTLIGGTGYTTEDTTGNRKIGELVFSKNILSYKLNSWVKTGEVAETVAYHEVVALNLDLCIGLKEQDREERMTTKEEGWSSDNFVDIR